jgi:MarR family transcriptional regulator, transcriptional regulator for hemolysin
MSDSFPNTSEAMAFAIEDIGRLLRRRIDGALAAEGLSRPQWRLLAYVLREPGLTQTILAQRLELARAATGVTVDQLERDGLIERRPDPEDRRLWRLHPSAAALTLLARLRNLGSNLLGTAFRGFAADEITVLAGLFDRIITNLEETDR